MTFKELQAENERLKGELAASHEFTKRLAQRLFLAAEVLSIVAEKKSLRKAKMTNERPAG